VSTLRTLAAQARRIPSSRIDGHTHPATISRWLIRGVRLKNGSVHRLIGLRSPGGWLVSDEAMGHFLAVLTADRTGEPAPAASSATAARAHELAGLATALDAKGY
jgi:hypothetical protein